MIWDAENRLKEIIDNKEGLFHSYRYDHTGERILKRYGTAQNAFYNGKDMGTLHDFGESYSAYASAYNGNKDKDTITTNYIPYRLR